jgi:hypothetical protein
MTGIGKTTLMMNNIKRVTLNLPISEWKIHRIADAELANKHRSSAMTIS